MALHQAAERARRAGLLTARGRTVAIRSSWAWDSGDIAVMGDGGGVVARRNPFNLAGRALLFSPSDELAASYRFSLTDSRFDQDAVDAGAALDGLGDDDARAASLPFEFPYFGVKRTQMYVHSDGNVTFEEPEASSSARSLGRLASGPPRIAPLFDDLDPTKSGCDVRVWTGPDRAVVTWRNVPEYVDFGTGARQTVQLVLYADGRIAFSFTQVTGSAIVTGISPGRLRGEPVVVSFLQGSAQAYDSTVAERFGSDDEMDIVRAAQRFYESHEDSYDYLVLYNTSGIRAGATAVAYETTVRSARQGIGDTPVDVGASFGSPRRLQSVLNMGPLSQYPRDPNGRVAPRGPTGDTPMSLIGHEAGHLFLALASIRDPDDPSLRPMLGAQSAHWSFNFDSEASVLEGNRIQDNGPGANPRFRTVGTVEGYSPLDQYLMGFRAPEDVPPAFLVRHSLINPSRLPQVGVTISGDRLDISVDDVIAAEGRRVPGDTVAQRRFRFAFVLVVPEGAQPSPEELQQVESYRAEFERYFTRAADGRAWADCTLRRELRFSPWPASGVVAGRSAPMRVEIAQPADNDVTVMLWSPQGIIGIPETVTIPRGEFSVTFAAAGVNAGVADLVAEAAAPGYEAVFARIPVVESAAELRLREYWRGYGWLVVRAEDWNAVPYVGLGVNGVMTDQLGLAWFVWDAQSDLAVEIDGAPSTRIVVKAAPR